MMEALSSSETSVLTGVTRRNIRKHGYHHSPRLGNLKSYLESIDLSQGCLWFCELRLSILRLEGLLLADFDGGITVVDLTLY
jgi:hypothetical protein